MASLCKIDLLGGLRVTHADRVITRFRTEKTAVLLAYLAYHSPRSYPRAHLAELLWPDGDPDSSRQGVRTALSSLRHQLEPPGVAPGSILLADRASAGLNPAGVTVDVTLFRDAIRAAGRAASPAERVRHWVDAVEAYQGELLSGYWDDWILGERQHLASLFLQAAERLVAHYEDAKEYPEALHYARQASLADPLREEAARQMIRLYAASGQSQVALEYYRDWEQSLERELGAVPSDATRALVREIQSAGGPPARPSAVREVASRSGVATAPERRGTRPPVRARLHADLLTPLSRQGSASPASTDTVTFLLADVDPGVQQQSGPLHDAVGEYRLLARSELQRHNGRELREVGTAVTAMFGSGTDAVRCAIAIQTAAAQRWRPGATGGLRLRIALHTGDVDGSMSANSAKHSAGDVRAALQTAGRILLAAHGGQILCSEATAVLQRQHPEAAVQLVGLGMHHLVGCTVPERLFQVGYEGMPSDGFPPLKPEAAYVTNLPAQVTRFFGREEEAERLRGLLLSPDARLVTLTGPGGSGKTRLALEVAGRLLGDYHGAVWFAPLAEIRDASAIADSLLDALQLPRSPGHEPLEQVIAMLSAMPALLVLDNLEQIAEDGGLVLSQLLARVPSLTCLVTSRRSLDMPGERQFPVPPLPVPNGDEPPESLVRCASVRLFVDRAQAVRPDYQVTAANAAALAEICGRLEGIPLALELVAARAQVLSPAQMLSRMGQRLDWQGGQQRRAVDRHRTLRAAMDWSYRLLDPEIQRLFACLSVFRGSLSWKAAVAVCAAGAPSSESRTLEYLRQLRAHSLVLAQEHAGEVRFRLLETVREYAWECLTDQGEAESACRRHAEFFLALAEEADPNLQGWEKQARLDQLETEHDNLLAALSWSAEADPILEGRLAGALAPFWELHGHSSEGRRRLDAVLAQGADLPEQVRGKVLLGTARLAWYQGDFQRAGAVLEEALAGHRRAGDQDGIAMDLVALGDVAHRQARLDDARALYQESLGIFRALEHSSGVTLALYRLGMATSDSGDYAAAVPILEEALALAKRDGDKAMISAVMSMLGQDLFRLGQTDTARALCIEAEAMARDVGDLWATVFAEWSLGNMALVLGDVALADSLFRDGMPRIIALANKWAIAYGLEAFGCMAAAKGKLEPAARLLGAAGGLREAIGAPLPPANRPPLEGVVAAVRGALGETAFARCWASGREMAWQQAAHYALET